MASSQMEIDRDGGRDREMGVRDRILGSLSQSDHSCAFNQREKYERGQNTGRQRECQREI